MTDEPGSIDASLYVASLDECAKAATWIQKSKDALLDRRRLGLPYAQPEHKTVPLKFGDEQIEIDEEIAPLIQALWEVGIHTIACCEGHEGDAFVCFETQKDAERFMLRMFVTGIQVDAFGYAMPWELEKWRWVTWPHINLVLNASGSTVPTCVFGVRLDFPADHIPLITKYLGMKPWEKGVSAPEPIGDLLASFTASHTEAMRGEIARLDQAAVLAQAKAPHIAVTNGKV